MNDFPWLTVIAAAPLAGAFVLMLLPRSRGGELPKQAAFAISLIPLVLAIIMATGYDTVITGFAGYTAYNVEGKPKVVLYWHMEPSGESEFEPNQEVSHYEWVSALEAVDRLTYEKDKGLLRRLVTAED